MEIRRLYFPSNDLRNCLNAIADKLFRQADVAGFYADCIVCDSAGGGIDWTTINKAIVTRWPKGLLRVKTMAWKKAKASWNKEGMIVSEVAVNPAALAHPEAKLATKTTSGF